jgi:hypothetical protein
MIKEAIEKIIELDEIRTYEMDGRIYTRNRDQLQPLIKPEEVDPVPLEVCNLRSFIKYLVINPDGLDLDWLTIYVVDAFNVHLIGPLQESNCNRRFTYLAAHVEPCFFKFNQFLELEDFVISLQANFQRTAELGAVVHMLANLANENIRQNIDDGFTQSLQIKDGLTTKAEVKVQNPITLIPFRTFREVEQPAGEFILRLKGRGDRAPLVCLTVADGNAWQLQAIAAIRQLIAAWLNENDLTIGILS